MKFLYFKHVKDIVKKRKKTLILCGMALLLVVTGVLNYSLNKKVTEEPASTTTTSAVNFFDTYKTDRDY